MRKWGWRGAGVAAGGLGAAGQWWGGLAGAALIAAGGFAAPEVSDWLNDRPVAVGVPEPGVKPSSGTGRTPGV